ncbi:hypothetical protein BGO17_01165 [Candidatus Saccharibacteria bacterium 49-20]|mgnify:FL=1|nr:MAG: hypothetical protein BGO17_01165 [Candidatus Saccharibacteria bacterium 49-20]
MDTTTVITLLTINLIVLSVAIIAIIVAAIILVVKMNKIASNIQETTKHVASATEWLSPVKVFTEIFNAFRSVKK